MKATELMIGDYITVTPSGMLIQVAAMHKKKVAYHTCTSKLSWVREGLLRPILLTPEILEKNGWYHAKFHGSYGRKAMRIDGCYKDELPKGVDNALSFAQWSIDEKFMYHMLEIFMWVGSIHLKIEYVHELQHALRLCGIKKEIEL